MDETPTLATTSPSTRASHSHKQLSYNPAQPDRSVYHLWKVQEGPFTHQSGSWFRIHPPAVGATRDPLSSFPQAPHQRVRQCLPSQHGTPCCRNQGNWPVGAGPATSSPSTARICHQRPCHRVNGLGLPQVQVHELDHRACPTTTAADHNPNSPLVSHAFRHSPPSARFIHLLLRPTTKEVAVTKTTISTHYISDTVAAWVHHRRVAAEVMAAWHRRCCHRRDTRARIPGRRVLRSLLAGMRTHLRPRFM